MSISTPPPPPPGEGAFAFFAKKKMAKQMLGLVQPAHTHTHAPTPPPSLSAAEVTTCEMAVTVLRRRRRRHGGRRRQVAMAMAKKKKKTVTHHGRKKTPLLRASSAAGLTSRHRKNRCSAAGLTSRHRKNRCKFGVINSRCHLFRKQSRDQFPIPPLPRVSARASFSSKRRTGASICEETCISREPPSLGQPRGVASSGSTSPQKTLETSFTSVGITRAPQTCEQPSTSATGRVEARVSAAE